MNGKFITAHAFFRNAKMTEPARVLQFGRWEQLQISGTSPSGRFAHSTAVVEGVLYAFGGSSFGEGEDTLYHNDMYTLKCKPVCSSERSVVTAVSLCSRSSTVGGGGTEGQCTQSQRGSHSGVSHSVHHALCTIHPQASTSIHIFCMFTHTTVSYYCALQ